MTSFKAKLSKQGNGYCIYVPKDVRTLLDLEEEYEWYVRTNEGESDEGVRTPEVKGETGRLVFNMKKGIYERK